MVKLMESKIESAFLECDQLVANGHFARSWRRKYFRTAVCRIMPTLTSPAD